MAVEPSEPKSRCIEIGQMLVIVAWGCLTLGGAVVKLFFPNARGRGLTPELLCLLVPIWSLGVLGLLLVAVGWIMHPTISPRLHRPHPQRSDGRYFGPFVRALIIFTSGLCCFVFIAGPAIMIAEDGLTPLQTVVSYCVFCIFAFGFYLAAFYRERRDAVVTTYLNVFLFLFAFLLVPLLWPLVAFFQITWTRRRAFEAAWNGERRPFDP